MDLILNLFFGGYDTTSKTMAFVVKYLSENPQVISELRAENEAIERNKKENEMLSWEDYESMRFTRDVIKETLRLYLGISTGYFRETLEDVEIGGHKIPKGWTLIVYEKSCRLDSNYYEDPLNFNPWRWQDRDVTQAPFYPFGGGIRLCPGYELAMLQVSLFIHYLITKLKWERIASGRTKRGWLDPFFVVPNDIMIQAVHM